MLIFLPKHLLLSTQWILNHKLILRPIKGCAIRAGAHWQIIYIVKYGLLLRYLVISLLYNTKEMT